MLQIYITIVKNDKIKAVLSRLDEKIKRLDDSWLDEKSQEKTANGRNKSFTQW